jgi:hypothetical protein
MAWKSTRILTWSSLTNRFNTLFDGTPWNTKYLFRGQSNADWKLADSLFRVVDSPSIGPNHFIDLENLALRNFAAQAHLFLDSSLIPGADSLLLWWSIMQHFGCPTRLLDWTGSPFVATYFAVAENPDRDGAVWVFDGKPLLSGEPWTRPGISAAQKRLQTSKNERELFWERDRIRDLVYPFIPTRYHPRLAAQQGAFTVCTLPCDHGESIDRSFSDTNHTHCQKIIIKKKLKGEIITRLMRMNVTAGSLFPGLEGLAGSTRELLRLSTQELRRLSPSTEDFF